MSGYIEYSKAGAGIPSRGPVELRSPEAIQPHGVLLALDGPDMVVARASNNTERVLGVPHEELLGRPIGTLLQEADLQVACRLAREGKSAVACRLDLAVSGRDQARKLSGSVHRSGRFVVLELEPSPSEKVVSFTDVYRYAREVIARLQSQTRTLDICALAAEEMRAMIDFDRVLICRVDEDGNGEVIAESREEDVPSFLGVRYPGLRSLFQDGGTGGGSVVRHIPDASSQPAALVPAYDVASGGALDLSACSLRSVSPAQLAYLEELGVRACMYVSLVSDGEMWGFILCHHGVPRVVPREVRGACELLGQALSGQLGARERAARQEQALAARMMNARLVARVCGRARYQDGLIEEPDALLGIVDASGAAMFCDGDVEVVGEVPPEDDIARLIPWIVERMRNDVFYTRSLSELYPPARGYERKASGVLAIRVPESPTSFVLWFRPEISATARPGWSPDESWLEDGLDAALCLLLQGMREWEQTMRGKARPWRPWEIAVVSELRHTIVASLSRRTGDLAWANEQLRAASLLREEFLSTLSHELRTPLNAIMGWAHLLQSGDLPDERRTHAVGVILRNARMQTRLVDDLLDISRLVRGRLHLKTEPMELVDLIEGVVASMKTAADAKALAVQMRLDPDAGRVTGDPARLQQVIWNLLSNAIKYTPKGGRVQVSLQRRSSSVDISVADTGVGISAEQLPHVFDRFRRGEVGASRGGLGLGLAIVRSLVELHGGTVEARSEGAGRGACFVVTLPLAPLGGEESDETEERSGSNEPMEADSLPLSKLHIMVVEDDEDSQDLLAEVLRDHGAQVTAVGSGPRALAALDRGTPDVIVSDIGMPGMDGYELIRRVRERPEAQGGRVPAIALTAYVRAQDRSRAFLAGYQAHMPKPLDIAKLLSLIESLTGRPF